MNKLSPLKISAYVLFMFLSKQLYALDETIEKLDLSGLLRLRSWYTGSQAMVPGKFPASEEFSSVDYYDLFFRNRFTLKIFPELEVRAVFDIGAIFGKSDFALGNGKTNLITRDVYAVFKPMEECELSIGLQPFSFQGGYILARDASGIQYTQHFFNRKAKIYAGIIKAFDDADASYSDEVRPPRYADDNIYFLGSAFSASSLFFADCYYIYEYDRYTSINSDESLLDNRTSSLSWAAFHGKFVLHHWIIRAGGIANFGSASIYDTSSCNTTNIRAFLGEVELGYRINIFHISFIGEGATGDINNPNDAHSFQVIKSSHEFSYIAVDNFGGISLRASGASSWYGLTGCGLKLQYMLWDAINIEGRLLHFRRTTVGIKDSQNHFGDEANIRIEYLHRELLSLFVTGAIFRPGDAYYGLSEVDGSSRGSIIEIMFGAQLNY